MFDAVASWVGSLVQAIISLAPEESMLSLDFQVRALLALLLVSLVCGTVGSLVVSNRMAFFSDALAHTAFAGVALGLLISLVAGVGGGDFRQWITVIMVGFGITVGLLMAYVQEQTGLPSDTVIGVFFAAMLGLGAVFVGAAKNRQILNIEAFIFGDPLLVENVDLVWLLLLIVVTLVFLGIYYNPLVFGSFNESLARSRRVPSRQARYLFVILLALIVNLCQQTVGILLINGLLIVPGAAAANLSRNLRQLFWLSLGISVFCAVGGLFVSYEIFVRTNQRIQVGVGGMVVILNVGLFMLSMFLRPWVRGRG